MSSEVAFGFLANAMTARKGGDGDTGSPFPRTDAEDMSRGARWIPGNVTLARREGQKVDFVTECGPNCWYWQMTDGSRIYHFDPAIYEQIGITNGRKTFKDENGRTRFEDGPGPCPYCGNPHTGGGTIEASSI